MRGQVVNTHESRHKILCKERIDSVIWLFVVS